MNEKMLKDIRKIISMGFVFFMLIACDSSLGEKKLFNHELIEAKTSEPISWIIDTISFQIRNSSYVGAFKIFEDRLFFLDKVACRIYELDLNGNVLSYHLGLGEGPDLLPKLQEFIVTEDFYIVTHGYKYYVYDRNWQRINHFVINWTSDKSQDLLNNPNPKIPDMYEVEYSGNRLFYDQNSDELIFKIVTEHPKFNAFASKEFYSDARILARMDLKNGSINSVFGRYSPRYSDYSFIPFHISLDYQYVNNYFFVSYPVDSLIYVFDEEFNPKFAFGSNKDGITGNYEQTNYLSAFEDLELEKRTKNEGIYSSLWVFDDGDLVLRKYQTDNGNDYGIQVYYKYQLSADFEVNSDFSIIGKKGDTLFAVIEINETEERFQLAKIRLHR